MCIYAYEYTRKKLNTPVHVTTKEICTPWNRNNSRKSPEQFVKEP